MAFSKHVESEQVSGTAFEMPDGYLAELPVYRRLADSSFMSPEEEARLKREPFRFPQNVGVAQDKLTALGFAADNGFSFYSSTPESDCVKSSSSFGFGFLGKYFGGRKFELDRSCQLAGLAREAAALSLVGFTGGKGGEGGVTASVLENSLNRDSHSASPATRVSFVQNVQITRRDGQADSHRDFSGVELSRLLVDLGKFENRSGLALDLVRLSADTAVVSRAYDQALKQMTNKPNACLIESQALKRNLMQCDI